MKITVSRIVPNEIESPQEKNHVWFVIFVSGKLNWLTNALSSHELIMRDNLRR